MSKSTAADIASQRLGEIIQEWCFTPMEEDAKVDPKDAIQAMENLRKLCLTLAGSNLGNEVLFKLAEHLRIEVEASKEDFNLLE